MSTVWLVSAESERFEVDLETVARQSQLIRDMVNSTGSHSNVPLPNIPAHILQKVIDYCYRHGSPSAGSVGINGTPRRPGDRSSSAITQWEREFVNQLDMPTLLALLDAADYLSMRSLFNLVCVRLGHIYRFGF
ncbi:hypothetical protein L7F22_035249 [Adiantum nelumboides]|nr:hypothetical protein [Adiantum nelumboides]